MAIEIKELIVRIVVTDEKSNRAMQSSQKMTAIPMKKIVDECVEKVMEKLEAKMEDDEGN